MDTTSRSDLTHINLERFDIIRFKNKHLHFNICKYDDRIRYVCLVSGKGMIFSKREAGNLLAIKDWISADIKEYKKKMKLPVNKSLTGTNRYGIYLSSSTINHF